MKNPVVRSTEEFADSDTHFITCDGRGNELFAASAECLSGGPCCRENDGCRVQDRTIVEVILFSEVRCSGVDHGREERASGSPGDQHFAGTGLRAKLQCEFLDGLDGARSATSQCGSE